METVVNTTDRSVSTVLRHEDDGREIVLTTYHDKASKAMVTAIRRQVISDMFVRTRLVQDSLGTKSEKVGRYSEGRLIDTHKTMVDAVGDAWARSTVLDEKDFVEFAERD